jgi:hypothetical protein
MYEQELKVRSVSDGQQDESTKWASPPGQRSHPAPAFSHIEGKTSRNYAAWEKKVKICFTAYEKCQLSEKRYGSNFSL